MGFNTSTNMRLPVPQVGNEAGPQYATDINNCLTLIDAHDHAAGSGVPISPTGLNINSDLSFNNNNLTSARSLRLFPQAPPLSNPSDLGCLYESGVDLYYNDGAGNQVRITQSGGVAGSPGSISNLTSPASAAYVSGNLTFVWESSANTAANMDAGSFVLRNITANSKGLTLSPPNAMAADYSLTLPSLPAQTNIMTLDASGNMGAVLNVDNSTLDISTNQIQIKSKGITQGLLALRTVGTTAAAGGVAYNSVTDIAYSSSTPLLISTITLTTTGRPVVVSMTSGDVATSALSFIRIDRNASTISTMRVQVTIAPASGINILDFPTAGTHTYDLYAYSTATIDINGCNFFAYEL